MLLLAQILVVCIVAYCVYWVVGTLPVPNPPGPIPVIKGLVQIVVVLIACVLLLELAGLFSSRRLTF